MEEGFRTQDYLLYAIPMLDFEPEFNVGLWTQFSLIKGSNLILELEPDDPIGQFNNMFWTSANDSISLSKKLTCWVLKGPTGQSSPGKATESRGVGMRVGGMDRNFHKGGVRNCFFDFPSLIPIMGENAIRTWNEAFFCSTFPFLGGRGVQNQRWKFPFFFWPLP